MLHFYKPDPTLKSDFKGSVQTANANLCPHLICKSLDRQRSHYKSNFKGGWKCTYNQICTNVFRLPSQIRIWHFYIVLRLIFF